MLAQEGIELRLVEHAGRGEEVRLSVPPRYKFAELVNVLEDHVAPLDISDSAVSFDIGPHKVASVRLRP